MTSDPFTAASPTYVAAQKTNQAGGRGWCFDKIVDTAPWPVRVVEVLFRPSSVFSLSLLAVCVWLLVTQ